MRKITRNQLRQMIIQEARQLNRLDEADADTGNQEAQIELLKKILEVLNAIKSNTADTDDDHSGRDIVFPG